MATYQAGSNGLAEFSLQPTVPIYPTDTVGVGQQINNYGDPVVEPTPRQDRMKENPLEALELDELDIRVKALFQAQFHGKKSVTERELLIGARLARSNYANHERDLELDTEDSRPKSFRASMDTVNGVLEDHDWKALDVQKSKRFWKEPKAVLVTLAVCCVAPLIQGWDQAANGNLGWPEATRVSIEIEPDDYAGADIWQFGVVNAIMWFAAMAGPFLFDPICNATFLGRRGSVFITGVFSLAASLGSASIHTWQQLLACRMILGIAIGARASIVPVWESEILPPAKRGRVLVSWQTSVALGLLFGHCTTYYFIQHWEYQVISGALPAITLLVLVYIGCESPRWLIVQERYLKAFETLVHLRGERLLAAEEFCYTYFQIQTERALALNMAEPDFTRYQPRTRYFRRLLRLVSLVRNRRALIATTIVMLAQPLSGINIIALLGTTFFKMTHLDARKKADTQDKNNVKLSIGFAAATVAASALAYFLVEPLPVDASLDELYAPAPGAHWGLNSRKIKGQQRRLRELQRLLRGRKRLLLISLACGTIILGALTGLLSLPSESRSRAPAVAAFIFFLGICYAPGVGAVPFLYSTEVWPNEARDVGMSVGVLVNFFGAAMVTLVVPLALDWGFVKLFGIFTGLSAFAFLLVYFFVPCTNKAVSLEEMSAIFEHSLFQHARDQVKEVIPFRISRKQKTPMNPSVPYTGPYMHPPQRAFSEPLPGQQSFGIPISTQYVPYGYQAEQYFHEAPPIPQPYYPMQVSAQSSPHGSISMTQSQGFGSVPAVNTHQSPLGTSNSAQFHHGQR
ncbi:MFS general substrate transporter [Lophiostoma macrostomum CBS 122681]|uniref:MFS general substrate transporter n=1 Tax=Lophiostoma macrostomum CBS 122681 TaxID=1314788 RepID=A0A6A6TKB1_9PLEO|nr:MFS general substrate transporter [Lophiostoma macrostomum CBS 122681]